MCAFFDRVCRPCMVQVPVKEVLQNLNSGNYYSRIFSWCYEWDIIVSSKQAVLQACVGSLYKHNNFC